MNKTQKKIGNSIKIVKTTTKYSTTIKALKKKRDALLFRINRDKLKLDNVRSEIKQTFRQNPLDYMNNSIDVLIESIEEFMKLLNRLKKSKVWRKLGDFEKYFFGVQYVESSEFLKTITEGKEIMEMMVEEKQEQMEINFEENFKRREKPPSLDDLLKSFSAEAEDEEKKNIRNLYLELVKTLHPDKFTNEEEKSVYHQLMIEVNEAYAMNDYEKLEQIKSSNIHSLLDLELSHKSEQEREKREVEILEEQIKMYQLQHERIKEEISAIKKSEIGKESKLLSKTIKKQEKDQSEILEKIKTISKIIETALTTGFVDTEQILDFAGLQEIDMDDSSVIFMGHL